jgi:hypothetical protein
MINTSVFIQQIVVNTLYMRYVATYDGKLQGTISCKVFQAYL